MGDFQQEEVDLASTEVKEPPNYGWPVLEGTAETGVEDKGEPLVEPVLTYERTGKPDDPNCAITGGHVVRDPALEPLEGRYIYADYCRGVIESAKPSEEGLGEPEPTGLELLRIASFAQDAGEALVRGHAHREGVPAGFRVNAPPAPGKCAWVRLYGRSAPRVPTRSRVPPWRTLPFSQR